MTITVDLNEYESSDCARYPWATKLIFDVDTEAKQISAAAQLSFLNGSTVTVVPTDILTGDILWAIVDAELEA